MKRFMITEEQLQTLREETMRWMPHHVAIDVLDMLAGLSEHISVTLEAQPEAPKDWSGHEHYGDCHYCEINEQYSKQAACWVCMHLVDCGKVDNWQPRTP